MFFHSLSNYDSHFIVTQFDYDTQSIHVIPNTEEKFISFTKYISNKFQIKFVDTLQFMPSSLENLAFNLLTLAFDKFKNIKKKFFLK